MNLNCITLGYAETTRLKNGSKIERLTDLNVLDNIASGKSKTELPLTYCYFGIKGAFMRSNVYNIDIDTAKHTDAIFDNIDEINLKLDRSIVSLSESYSRKVHLIIHGPMAETERQHGRYAEAVRSYATKAINETLNIKLEDELNSSNESQPAVDDHNDNWKQGMFWSGRRHIEFDFAQLEIELSEEQEEQKTKASKKAAMTYENLEPFTGEVEFQNAHKIKVDRNYNACGYTGNDVRMQYANVLLYYCKGDRAKFYEMRKMLFKNWDEVNPVNTSGNNYSVCLRFKKVFDEEFGVILKSGNQKTCKFVKPSGFIEIKRWLTEHEKTITDMLKIYNRIKVVSPTGTGKTVFINKLAEKDNKTLIVVPYNSQLVNYNGCNVLTPDNKFDYGRSNVGVVDQCVKYISKLDESWTIIIDETHLVSDDEWREAYTRLNYKMKYFKGKVIGFTATAGIEDSITGFEETLVFYKERKPLYAKWYDVKWPVSQIPKFINKNRTTIVFSDAHNMKLYDNWIAKNGPGSAALLRSDTQDKMMFKRTIEEQRLVAKTNFSTKILYSGNNFNNEEPVTIIIETNPFIDYTYIVQAVGRFRKSEDIEVIIINNVNWRRETERTSQEIIAKQGILGKQEALNARDDDSYVDEEAMKRNQGYQDTLSKPGTIDKLTQTGYINVIDYGELLEDNPTHEIDEVKREISNKIVSDIINNENFSTEYFETDHKYEKQFKKELDKLAAKLGKSSIREYVLYRTYYTVVQIDTIIRDLYIIYGLDEYSKEEREAIRDDWRGFVKKTVDQNIDPITLMNIKHRAKVLSDILNSMEVNIDYDNGEEIGYQDIFDVKAAFQTAINLSRIDAETRRETRKAASSKGGKISSPKKAVTIQYLGELDSMDEELIKKNGIYECKSKGEARAIIGCNERTFLKFIKGEKCKIDKLWRLVSVE